MDASANIPLRILILEDHEDTRVCLKRFLESLGYSVLTAGSVKEATETIRNSDLDVLISDIGLGDGLGWDFLENLYFTKPVFAIAMSGLGTPADVARSVRAGFAHHLTKPVELEVLCSILERARKTRRSPL